VEGDGSAKRGQVGPAAPLTLRFLPSTRLSSYVMPAPPPAGRPLALPSFASFRSRLALRQAGQRVGCAVKPCNACHGRRREQRGEGSARRDVLNRFGGLAGLVHYLRAVRSKLTKASGRPSHLLCVQHLRACGEGEVRAAVAAAQLDVAAGAKTIAATAGAASGGLAAALATSLLTWHGCSAGGTTRARGHLVGGAGDTSAFGSPAPGASAPYRAAASRSGTAAESAAAGGGGLALFLQSKKKNFFLARKERTTDNGLHSQPSIGS
jgi:hypothetical protein